MQGSNLYMKDIRSVEEIKKQSEVINEVTKANMQLFRTKLEEIPINKEKQNLLDVYLKMNAIELETVKLETMYFNDNDLEGAHCQYSLHIPQNHLRFAYPVLTLSGIPSYIHEWNYLAENSQAIWINFLEPGLETLTEEQQQQQNKNGIIGADERRGKKFNGSIQDTVKMIVKLLDKLGYNKVILMCHSFGFWLFTALQKLCPDRIVAAAELGAFGITAHEMVEHNYGVFSDFIKEEGLESYLRELDGSDEDRLKLLEYACKKSPYYKNVLKALNMHTSIFVVQKTLRTFPGGLTSYKEIAREEGIGFLTFLAGGKNDVVTKQSLLEECYYHYYEKSQIKLNSEQDKEFLQNYVKREIIYNGGDEDLDVENLQKNFIFLFENTGHSVHQIRSKELLVPLRVFFRTVEGLELIKEARGCQSKL